MCVVLARETPVNLAPNSAAPLAAWAPQLQARGYFEDGGRGPDAFDCMGIALWVQRALGRLVRDYLELYAELDIRRTRDVDALFRAEAESWRQVDVGDVGDVLVLGSGHRAHHVAVLCGAGHALHAHRKNGVAIEPIMGRSRVTHFADMAVFGCVRPA